MPAYLICYPKGQGEDVLVEDDQLTLTTVGEWAVLADRHGTCMAVPAHAAATITRIDPPDEQADEE